MARLASKESTGAKSKTAPPMWIIAAAGSVGALVVLTLIIVIVVAARSGRSHEGGVLRFDSAFPTAADSLWEQHIAQVHRLTKDLKNGRSVEDCVARQQAMHSDFERKFDGMPLSDDDRRKVYDKYGPKLKAATDEFLDAMLSAP